MPELSALQLIIGFLLLLTPVVFFHELGHYWVARRAGVVVEVFSVGFGPEIYGWTSKKTGTRWRFAAIPLGGYVRMRGDENEASGAPRMRTRCPEVSPEPALGGDRQSSLLDRLQTSFSASCCLLLSI